MNNCESNQERIIALLRNPDTGNPLTLENGSLKDTVTGEHFMVRNSIPVILRKDDVFGWNRKQQKGYDWGSYLYDLLYKFKLAKRWLSEISGIMEVKSGDYVLETSVGTGQQLLNLKNHGVKGHFFGNDISHGMLRRCKKNLKKWGLDAGLVQGNAETLPFGDKIFDVVYHVGGFNFFNDKKKAISEMIRVAKPGAKLYIVDESDSIRDEQGIVANVIGRFLPDREVFAPPVKLVPEDMIEIRDYSLLDRKFWMVSFQKPVSLEE